MNRKTCSYLVRRYDTHNNTKSFNVNRGKGYNEVLYRIRRDVKLT